MINIFLTVQVQQSILEGRDRYYRLAEDGVHRMLKGSSKDIRELESRLKHPLFPDNAYLKEMPEFDLFNSLSSCELHAASLGMKIHIVKASLFAYEMTLRDPRLVSENGDPL